ncbi:MAG: MerR family transcriptional regulator [Anaerolineales bacterium]|nr:MerR family transcriptional regulator [Anaerolineales bacterium]
MIRIGDFSKLSRVSIKTLRYYDEMGLLKPIEVDRFTGYRYYDFDQLPRLYRILALKELGFSLDEINRFLEENSPVEQIRGMLKLRQSEIKQRVQEETNRLERVELWLKQIQQEDSMSNYDVVLKKIEGMKVASIRGIVPTPPDQRSLWNELMGYLYQNNIRMSGTPMAIYHDAEKTKVTKVGILKLLCQLVAMLYLTNKFKFMKYQLLRKWHVLCMQGHLQQLVRHMMLLQNGLMSIAIKLLDRAAS